MSISPLKALVLGAVSLLPLAGHAQSAPPIALRVDMTDAARNMVHVTEILPAHPGENTFEYPQWIPGEHMAVGPIDGVAGVFFRAGGNEIPWRRDLVDMYALHVTAPDGTQQIELSFDFLAVPGMFNSTAALGYGGLSPAVAMVELSTVVFYPANQPVRDIPIALTLHLPAGWRPFTALQSASQSGVDFAFASTSVEQLVDSPVLMGSHCKQFPLAPEITPKHTLDVCGDTDADVAFTPETLAKLHSLVREATALYGSHHYAHYDFLLAISTHIQGDSLEHHQSADYRVHEFKLDDPNYRFVIGELIPHEYSHSWCGKYSRPIGLATPDYKTPMQDDLLWVYEGLDEYLGWLLNARSGFWSTEDFLSKATYISSQLDSQPGARWRNVQDTADAAQLLRGGPAQWANWRRGQDYYYDGAFFWLEADIKIQRLTHGKKSLADFNLLFFGGPTDNTATVVSYTFADVVRDLNSIAPYDWAGFWQKRLTTHDPSAPLAGLKTAGYDLVRKEAMSPGEETFISGSGAADMWDSLGVQTDPKGNIPDVRYYSPAYQGGFGPDDQIITVNGQPYSADVLRKAVTNAKSTTTPIEFKVLRAGDSINLLINYHDGEKYPWLVRDPSQPDLLLPLLTPRSPLN
jgi:predicted metalloprotease with PDZ domain